MAKKKKKKQQTQTMEDIVALRADWERSYSMAHPTERGGGLSFNPTFPAGGGLILAPRGETTGGTTSGTTGGYGTPPTSAALPTDVGTGPLAEPQPTGTEGSYQAITDMFQQAMDAANAANEARYQQGMGIYQDIAGMFGPGSTYGQGQTAMLEQQKTQDVAKAQQHMAGSGLWNTTVAAAIPQAWEANVGMPGRLNIEDMRMGRYAGALEGMAGFVERRTDQGPDMGMFANLMAGASQGPGGYGSTATPSYGASVTQGGGVAGGSRSDITGVAGAGGGPGAYRAGGAAMPTAPTGGTVDPATMTGQTGLQHLTQGPQGRMSQYGSFQGVRGGGGGATAAMTPGTEEFGGIVGRNPLAQETLDRGQADRAQRQQLQAAGGVIGPGGGVSRVGSGAMQSLGRRGAPLGTAAQQSYGNYAVANRAPRVQIAQDVGHYGAGSSRRR